MARKILTVREKIERSKIKINPRYTFKLSDILELYKSDSSWEALDNAFCYGYIQGVKAAKKEAKGASV